MYSQKEKDGMAMKNATIDKFSAKKDPCPDGYYSSGGDCISKKIKSTDEQIRTYNDVTYTKKPSYSSEGCSPGQSKKMERGPNAGSYCNITEKMKTLEPKAITKN
jgi:hypothetical protein